MSDNHSFFFVVRKFQMYSLGIFEVYNTVDYNHHAIHYISINLLIFINTSCKFVSFKPRVPNLQDLMPDDLRWSWCDNNNCTINVIESSPNHPSTPICGNTVFHVTDPWCQNVRNHCGLTRISLIPHTAASGNHHPTLCFYELRFFIFHIYVMSHSACLFLFGFPLLARCPQGPSSLLRTAGPVFQCTWIWWLHLY